MQYFAAFLPEVFCRCSLSWIKVSAARRAGCPVDADICLAASSLFVFFLSTLAFCAAPSDKKLRRLDAYLFYRENKGLRS